MFDDVKFPDRIFDGTGLTIRKVPFYNDEPKIYQYVADLRSPRAKEVEFRGYGTDFDKDTAITKAVFEAIERMSLADFDRDLLINRTIRELGQPFVHPSDLQHFTSDQVRSPRFSRMLADDNSVFSWVPGTNAVSDEVTFLPSQTVFFPYSTENEPILRFPSTNGAACGRSLTEAICRGLLEVIERDSFMCWYLTKTPAKRLELKAPSFGVDFERITETFGRYNLDLQLLLLPSQWLDYPVVLAILLDPTGIGPWLTAGLKCHPNLKSAIRGAVCEAQQKRPWLRDHMWLWGSPNIKERSEVRDFWSRAFFWSAIRQNTGITSLWENTTFSTPEEISANRHVMPDWHQIWNSALTAAKNKGFDLFVVDMSDRSGYGPEIKTVKVIIPQAHSLYMDENFQYLYSKSLAKALKLYGPRWEGSFEEDNEFEMPPHFFC